MDQRDIPAGHGTRCTRERGASGSPSLDTATRDASTPSKSKGSEMPAQTMSDHAEVPSPLEKLYQEAAADANSDQRKELYAAAQEIAGQDLSHELVEKAFCRAADAIKNGVNVFISYKSSHEPLAMQFAEVIRFYGQSRLAQTKTHEPSVFFAAQDIKGGDEWRSKIEKAIAKAHWFILLLPDVAPDRDWLVYEAAYFKRGMSYSERLICVHHKDAVPAPQFENLQAYQSSPEGLQKMLKDLFLTPGTVPGMRRILNYANDEMIADDARKLSESLQGTRSRTEYCGKYIEIQHNAGVRYESEEEMLCAQVTKIHGLTDAFSYEDTFKGTFAQLINSVNDDAHGRAWIEALRIVLNAAVAGKTTRAVEVPFIGKERGTAFRPSLHFIQRVGENGSIERFHVIFVEDFGQQIPNAPAKLDLLETVLRWSYRSWWEIYHQYPGHLTADDVDEIRRYTARAEQEAQARGLLDLEEMTKLFSGDPGDPEARAIEATWQDNLKTYHKEYRNPEGTGKIDRAFRERNPRLMKECLDQLRSKTLWFLKEGSKRYAKLLAELD
jgi:hypothetical protein